MTRTVDIVPLTTYEAEFAEWARAAEKGGPSTQDPVDELLAEHHLMDAVLAAVEREARRLSVRGELRPDVWERVVDFTGNFVHQVHRRKEEDGIFPEVIKAGAVGDLASVEEIAQEHRSSRQLTIDLLEGVSDGDWEKVLRAAHVYLRVARDHLPREEKSVFLPSRGNLPRDVRDRLRRRFDALEKEALGDRTRKYYLDLARQLCRESGLTEVLRAS